MNITTVENTETLVADDLLLDLELLSDEDLAKVGGGQGIQLLG